MNEYKGPFWRELIQMIELSKCTLGEKKQLLNCWAQNLNIEKTKSWKSQEIIEDIERTKPHWAFLGLSTPFQSRLREA